MGLSEVEAYYSLRKWFKTRCEIAGMKPINIEKLMNHSVGISDSYYRATEQELLQDYLHAIVYLSINGNETKLTKEIEELKENSRENEYIIKGKLEEKDKQIKELVKRQEKYDALIQSFIDSGQLKPVPIKGIIISTPTN